MVEIISSHDDLMRVYAAAVNDYLNDLKYKGVSAATLKTREKKLSYWREYLEKRTDISYEPTTNDARSWRDELIDSGIKSTTAAQYLVEIGAFYKWATDPDMDTSERYFSKNPISKRIMPNCRREKARPYTHLLDAHDIALLWEDKKPTNVPARLWTRNYAIITLLLDGKIRNAELLDLRPSDIDLEYNEVKIERGKGEKFRIVSISKVTAEALRKYINSGLRPENVGENAPLFGTTAAHEFGRGNATEKIAWHRGTSQWLSKLVEKHVRDVTGKEGFRSHSLRHNGAMLDLNSGESLERLQAELGHENISTTQIYSGKLLPRREGNRMREAIDAREKWGEKLEADRIGA